MRFSDQPDEEAKEKEKGEEKKEHEKDESNENMWEKINHELDKVAEDMPFQFDEIEYMNGLI